MEILTINKNDKKLFGEITLPASKSISNRALIIKFLSAENCLIQNISEANDTILMQDLLNMIDVSKNSKDAIELDCGNAGTVIRFLTAFLSQQKGNWILTGNDRMKQRPIGILVDGLQQLGANIRYLEKDGFPPIQIEGQKLSSKEISIESDVSSQFISALLLIAPTLPNGLKLILKNRVSSLPYINMTLRLMRLFGIESTFNDNVISIKNQNYKSTELTVEPDWTSAAYWYEMVALADEANIILTGLKLSDLSTLTLKSGLNELGGNLQGDSILPEIYKSFGVKTEVVDSGIRLTKSGNTVPNIEFDFTDFPDLAQSVIVTCAALGIEGSFSGLESLRIKETDRLIALKVELEKCGFEGIIVRSSKFEVRNLGKVKTVIIDTYEDHRMAMAFAPLALKFDSVKIENPNVVSKSYPNFWNDLKKVGFEIN